MDRVLSNLNPLTEYAIVFVSLVGLFFQLRWSRRGVALGPTLLTTLGIFFCFLGIAIGLTDFDPNDVRVSIPHLLQGIRTSFWVSVTGIGWALTIKIRSVMFGDGALVAGGRAEGATLNDLAGQLQALNAAIAGESVSSLSSQAQLLRSDSNERLDKLVLALQNGAERTAETNSRVLIQALSEVVHDFNTKLNEQFGDNFKRLNLAVARLVEWQGQYERQISVLIEREAAMSERLTEGSARYAVLVERSTVFVDTVHSLSELLSHLNKEREGLAAGLAILAGLIEKASAGLPQIEKNIVEMTHQIARGVHTNQEMLGAVLKSSWQSVQVHNQHLTAILAKSLELANQDAGAHILQASEDAQKHKVA